MSAGGGGSDRRAARRYAFQPHQRVRRPPEFKRLYAQGRRLGNEFFTATFRPNEYACARLGMSVAARTIGNAVQRNRVRRLIRDSFRLHQHELPPVDLVIGMRPAARGIENPQLRAVLEQLWNTIIRRCASSSASSSGPTSCA